MHIFIPSLDEENWKGKNPPARAVTTTRRAITSMLNPIVDECAGLMLLKNGGLAPGKPPIHTMNTCGIDSFYFAIAALYADFKVIKEQIDEHKSNLFCDMISSMFVDEAKALKANHLLRKRALLLRKLYEGTDHVSRYENGLISIDCETNVFYIIPKLLPEYLYSYSRESRCDRCKKSTSSNRCFVDIDMNMLEQQTIKGLNNCILDTLINEHKECKCGGTKTFVTNFSNAILIDVSLKEEIPKMRLDEIPKRLNILGLVFELVACIQYIGDAKPESLGHYVAHIFRRNNRWQLYDDSKAHILKSNTRIEMKVQLLIYVKEKELNN